MGDRAWFWISDAPINANSGPPLPRRAESLIGRRIGRYQLSAPLGQGGMGMVFRARDHELGRDVAMKFLMVNTARGLERFRRECELSASLHHPGIVSVHSAGEDAGHPFLVTELIENAQSFSGVLTRLPREGRIQLLLEVTRAVAYAHEHGVVHRDIKPDNILVDPDGHPHVTDFGLAFSSDQSRLTRTGEIAGTPLYMAPEQLTGQRDTQGPHTDVWALGVLLYEALTDRLPFPADNLQEFIAGMSVGRFTRPRALDPSISAGLERVCMRALTTDSARRLPDAQAFAEAIHEALLNPSPGPSRLWTILAAALVVGVTAIVGWRSSRDEAPSPAPSMEASLLEAPSLTPPPALSEAEIAEGQRAFEEVEHIRDFKVRGEQLAEWRERYPGHPLDDSARALARDAASHGPSAVLLSDRQSGRQALFLSQDSILSSHTWGSQPVQLWLRAADGWEIRRSWSTSAPQDQPRLIASAPGGRRFAVTDPSAPLSWGRPEQEGLVTPPSPPLPNAITALAVAGSAEAPLAIVGVKSRVLVWPADDPASGFELPLKGTVRPRQICASPDGRFVAVGCKQREPRPAGRVRVWNVLTRDLVIDSPLDVPSRCLAFSPDGSLLAIGCDQGILRVYDTATGAGEIYVSKEQNYARLGLSTAHPGSIYSVALTPDGQHLYTTFNNGALERRELSLWDVEGKRLLTHRSLPQSGHGLSLTPDGEQLVVALETEVQVWGALTPQPSKLTSD